MQQIKKFLWFLVIYLSFSSISMAKSVEIYAHRGGAGLMPESTLAAFKNALALQVDVIDFDVALTKDLVVVAIHDPYLSPALTRDENGNWLQEPVPKIKNLTFNELFSYDVGALNPSHPYRLGYPRQQVADGERIPSLEQVIELIKRVNNKTVKLQLEIKTFPNEPELTLGYKKFVDAIVKIIDEHKFANRVEVHSYDWRNLIYMQQIAPHIASSYISEQSADFNSINAVNGEFLWTAGYDVKNFNNSVPYMIKSLGGKIWCPYYKDLNQDLVIEAQGYGLKVVPWTVNDEMAIKKIMLLGVDGVITDYPDIALRIRTAIKDETK